jgi:hypothetical protein
VADLGEGHPMIEIFWDKILIFFQCLEGLTLAFKIIFDLYPGHLHQILLGFRDPAVQVEKFIQNLDDLSRNLVWGTVLVILLLNGMFIIDHLKLLKSLGTFEQLQFFQVSN